jgi:hypothetical protein
LKVFLIYLITTVIIDIIILLVPQIVLHRSIDEAFEANDSLKHSMYFYSKFVEMIIDDEHEYDDDGHDDEKYCCLDNKEEDDNEEYVVLKNFGNKNNRVRRLEEIKDLNYVKGVFMITKIPTGKLSISDLRTVKTFIKNISCCFGIYEDSKGRPLHLEYFKKIQLVTKQSHHSSTDFVIQRYSPKRDFVLLHMAVDSYSEFDLPFTATMFPTVCATCSEKECRLLL